MATHKTPSTRTRHVGTLYFVALLRQELGRRIRTARDAANLTQQQLAVLINLKNGQDISRYERGLVEVPDFRIDLIATATNKPRSYFVRDPSEPEPINDMETRFGHLEAVVAWNQDVLVAVAKQLGVPVPPGQPARAA